MRAVARLHAALAAHLLLGFPAPALCGASAKGCAPVTSPTAPRVQPVVAFELHQNAPARRPAVTVFSNDMDFDGDGVPDWADGFGLFPGMEGNGIPGASFTSFRVRRPDRISAGGEIRFRYCASDPGRMTRDLRSVSFKEIEPDRWPAGVPYGHLRLWTMNADRKRNPAPANVPEPQQTGDYIPPDEWIPVGKLFGERREREFFLEGLHPTTGDGGRTTVSVDFREKECSDCTSSGLDVEVVRAIFRVYVWRPYIYWPEDSGTIKAGSRVPWYPDYSTPASCLEGLIRSTAFHFDPKGSGDFFHGPSAGLGHVFVLCLYQGPTIEWKGKAASKKSGAFLEWAGQTNSSAMKGIPAAVLEFLHLIKGDVMWASMPGEKNNPEELRRLVLALHGDRTFGIEPVRLLDHAGAEPRFIVSHEWRLDGERIRRMIEYLDNRDFSRFGMDVASTRTPGSRFSGGGCGSFIGLCMEYAGLSEQKTWWKSCLFPEVALERSGMLSMDYSTPARRRDACDQIAAFLHSLPELKQWGQGRPLRYVDPGQVAQWIIGARPVTVSGKMEEEQ